MKKVSILGCGWLGMPLAERLIEKDILVNGSSTRIEKCSLLNNKGIQPFLINLNRKESISTLKKFCNSDVLFINIPPTKASKTSSSYADNLKQLITPIGQSNIQKIIFVSSTSVYKNTNAEVREDSRLDDSERAIQLLEAENIFLNNFNCDTVIIRFAGLFGQDRNPLHHSNNKMISLEDVPVNMIHLEDCLRIAEQFILSNSKGVYNAAADRHPLKSEFYYGLANKMNLPPPIFSNKDASADYKIIISNKLKQQLDYDFVFPDPCKF